MFTLFFAVLTVVLIGIAFSLARIAKVLEAAFDVEKGAFRMVDVDRAKVYKTHLGGKLTDAEKSEPLIEKPCHEASGSSVSGGTPNESAATKGKEE